MDTDKNNLSSHPSEPVRTPENPLEYEWMTVDEAVAYCADRGLSRTPKTLRKWAVRSYNKPDADIIVRRADTIWGYRWKIETTSLARKVDEELSLAGVNPAEPVRTSAHVETPVGSQIGSADLPNSNEPARTGSNEQTEPTAAEDHTVQDEPSVHPSEPVRTRLTVQSASQVEQELRDRLKDKDAENAFLREQLQLAQAEVGKRANSTDEALKTIDRVVRSFEMQAEANKALALSGGATPEPASDRTPQIRFAPETVEDTEANQTTVPTDDHNYQQPQAAWDRV